MLIKHFGIRSSDNTKLYFIKISFKSLLYQTSHCLLREVTICESINDSPIILIQAFKENSAQHFVRIFVAPNMSILKIHDGISWKFRVGKPNSWTKLNIMENLYAIQNLVCGSSASTHLIWDWKRCFKIFHAVFKLTLNSAHIFWLAFGCVSYILFYYWRSYRHRFSNNVFTLSKYASFG